MIYNKTGTLTNDNNTPVTPPVQGQIPSIANQQVSPSIVKGGRSYNYVPGSSGWSIMPNGDCEFNNGVFRGTLQAAIIENGAGTVLIDATGLNSSNNFSKVGVSSTSQQTTSSQSYVDVPGSTLNSFTLTRAAVVIITYAVHCLNDRYVSSTGTNNFDGHWSNVQVVDSIDGVLMGDAFTGIPYVQLDSGGLNDSVHTADEIAARTAIFLLSAGAHVLKLQFKSTGGGSDTTYIDTFNFNYVILGI